MSDEQYNRLKAEIDGLKHTVQVQQQEIGALKRKWFEFERDMTRIAKNPSIITNEVQRQMSLRGMPSRFRV